jgi:hypothetical protein
VNPLSASRLAWSLWVLALGFAAAGLLLGVLSFLAELPEGREPFLWSWTCCSSSTGFWEP